MLPRVHRVTKGGKVYRWHRPTRTKLPDGLPETHPDFIAAWAAAEAKTGKPAPAKPGSVAEAVRTLKAGQEWRVLSAVYRTTLGRHLDAIMERDGDKPMSGVRAEHIEANMAPLAAHAANDRLKAWRRLCDHAKRAGQLRSEPARAVRRRAVKSEGHVPWTAAEVERFRARHPVGSVARLAFEVVFWTALRTVDAVTIGPLNVGRDGILTVRQSKTGGTAYVPWTAPLPAWAVGWEAERQGMLRCLRGDGLSFLAALERTRSVKGLGNLIADAAREAGIEKSAHGLRKARLTMAAEAGATAHAIMAWGGHKSLAEAERYTRQASLKRLVTGQEQNGTK
ncbi:tyrosine-type recombinase/integrase [Paracoccus sp. S-4012]|uniref:tyrosine-type recombinase/integrase n=1 Tax=Paracoccus sp. S-4012 TaxID=2665648 RepID=UPI0012AF5FF5|nr:tyrosine-type recombinase/integrase [Paracoccus sp. S-4012]